MTKRWIADLSMTALLPLLMTYSLLGEEAHEWLGAAMLVLLAAHHIWNAGWYRHLFRGRYSFHRAIQTAWNVLLLAGMLGSMASGILLSRYVFASLPLPRGGELAQLIHLGCAYWSFVLASLHLGHHWGMAVVIARKLRKAPLSPPALWILRGAAAFTAAYGVWAFFQNGFLDYLLLQTHFVFWSGSQTLATVLVDYLAILEALAFLGYYTGKALRARTRG